MSAHSDVSDVGARLERQGLAFLHQAREVRDLNSVQVERIAACLHRPAARPQRVWPWPALVAVLAVTVAGATFAAARGGLRALPLVGALFSPTPLPKPAAPRREHGPASARTAGRDPAGVEPVAAPQPSTGPSPMPSLAAPQPVAPAAVPTPTPATQPGRASAEAPRERPRMVALRKPSPVARAAAPKAEASAPAEVAEDPIVAESRSFATVVGSWHRQHDAGIALGLLDAHDRRYPAGHLRLEARVLRAELYLAQGRGDLALSVLDGMSLSGLPRARELQTLRGELRVKAGQCREARDDLGRVLDKSTTDALAKRATQALAHCR